MMLNRRDFLKSTYSVAAAPTIEGIMLGTDSLERVVETREMMNYFEKATRENITEFKFNSYDNAAFEINALVGPYDVEYVADAYSNRGTYKVSKGNHEWHIWAGDSNILTSYYSRWGTNKTSDFTEAYPLLKKISILLRLTEHKQKSTGKNLTEKINHLLDQVSSKSLSQFKVIPLRGYKDGETICHPHITASYKDDDIQIKYETNMWTWDRYRIGSKQIRFNVIQGKYFLSFLASYDPYTEKTALLDMDISKEGDDENGRTDFIYMPGKNIPFHRRIYKILSSFTSNDPNKGKLTLRNILTGKGSGFKDILSYPIRVYSQKTSMELLRKAQKIEKTLTEKITLHSLPSPQR